jgi:hypothetical protein
MSFDRWKVQKLITPYPTERQLNVSSKYSSDHPLVNSAWCAAHSNRTHFSIVLQNEAFREESSIHSMIFLLIKSNRLVQSFRVEDYFFMNLIVFARFFCIFVPFHLSHFALCDYFSHRVWRHSSSSEHSCQQFLDKLFCDSMLLLR